MGKDLPQGETRKPTKDEDMNDEAHAWKQRAPYRVHDSNESFKARYNGNCHCGRVKYELSREKPVGSKYCHCTTCQVQHAAPFQWAAIFHKEDINFERGHHDLEWYDSGEKSIEHKLPCKVRCSFCHSPIMDEGRNMILLFPTLIQFESKKDRDNFKPTCHMFYSQRVVDIPDGLPKWAEMNDKSDLIADSPDDAIRQHKRKREEEDREERKGQD